MSIITTATRMWLTRSFKEFRFTDEYDEQLHILDTENLGLYIHIPFCRSICPFCPYCKTLYEKKKCEDYVWALIREIHLVGSRYAESRTSESTGAESGMAENIVAADDIEQKTCEKKQVTSLYFGGGSPALALEWLPGILGAVRQYFTITEGIGIELHPGDVNEENLRKLKAAGITKISIGIQSFQSKFLEILGREQTDYTDMFAALKHVKFETVSMDFIFALPNQEFGDLQADIETAFANGANHVAIYPFIDFSFTESRIPTMSKRRKRKLLDEITVYCKNKGYHRDSIWTFSKEKEARYSSMTRDNFLGFGCSATTLLKDRFKINTFSVPEYEKRVSAGKLPTSLTLRFTKRQRMVYYLFWTAYTTRVRAADFERFFGVRPEKMYGFEIWLAKRFRLITEADGVYEMTLKGAFYYHYYEQFYTLAYIDKMWGIMRKEAFPREIRF